MKVERQALLAKLACVEPGLSTRTMVEQSTCFVFKDGRLFTFNDEIACSVECPELPIEGAVQAKPLLEILNRLPEDTVTFKADGSELKFNGRSRRGGVVMESEIELPIESVEPPKKFRPLNPDFMDGLSMVEKCAGTDENQFLSVCVHIHPNHIEAFDFMQLARYKVKTGIKQPTLVRKNSIRHIQSLGMNEVAAARSWLHFRNPTGLVMSVRSCLLEEAGNTMVDVDAAIDFSGDEMSMPKGLADAAEKASTFSVDNVDDTSVFVTLKKGRVEVEGRGIGGWYQERMKSSFQGEPLTFRIDPKLLGKIVQEHNTVEVIPGRLKVDTGKFVYVTSLAGKTGNTNEDHDHDHEDDDDS